MRIAQLRKIPRDHIHLRAPALVKIRARRQQLVPLKVGQVPLHAVPKSDRLIVSRTNGMPGQGDHCPVRILALHFGDHCRP